MYVGTQLGSESFQYVGWRRSQLTLSAVSRIRAPEGLQPPRSGRCPAHRMTLFYSRQASPLFGDIKAAILVRNGPPSITLFTLPTCPIPGWVAFPSTRAFPVSHAGRRPSLHFRDAMGQRRRLAQDGLPECSASRSSDTRSPDEPCRRGARRVDDWRGCDRS